uniref:Calcipressin-1-like n=1 Tax=Pundamilia nyererei TaxID=303518 RepID=A0A3B4GJH4_9CICH
MHIKTTKCNRFCLVASVTSRELFHHSEVQAGFEALFRSFDSEVQFQYFKSFRRIRISFRDALAAAEARLRLHKTDFNGKEMRLYFAQSVHIGSPRLEPPKPEKQFLISPPASPPVGWEQSQDATPVINYDLLCAISKLGPGIQHIMICVFHLCVASDHVAHHYIAASPTSVTLQTSLLFSFVFIYVGSDSRAVRLNFSEISQSEHATSCLGGS